MSSLKDDRQARLDELKARLRPAFEQSLEQAAQTLLDTPDSQLFGTAELALHQLGQDLAAASLETGLQGRKKGATSVPPSPAPTALKATPASSITAVDPF